MGALNLLITGASGYLGKHTIAYALAAGHKVTAVVRDRTALLGEWPASVRIISSDLNALTVLPPDIDVVLHLAASMEDDDAAQQSDTVDATKALISACLALPKPPAMVLASSLSVYSGMHATEGGVIDENSPMEDQSDQRDAYCRGKIAQELLCATSAADAGLALQILRIGAIYGPGRAWNAHVGLDLGPFLFRVGKEGEIPLSHVRHAAQALVLAAEKAAQGQSGVVNVVDDDLPDRKRFSKAYRKGFLPKIAITIPLRMVERVAHLSRNWENRPGLLRMPVLRARMLPLRYANDKLHELGWKPEAAFEDLMREALETSDD